MIVNNEFANLFSYPVRYVGAKVELYEGSTLADTYNQYYALKNLTIERVAEEGKFFGFGICQKINVHLVDKDRYIHITTADRLKSSFSVGGLDYVNNFPTFYVSEVHRDENTNELSVTAYDALYKATSHTFSELNLAAPYTIQEVAFACCMKLGLNGYSHSAENIWREAYEEGANLDGTETIREVLDAIAEVTQTIYYIDSKGYLYFKRLNKDGEPVFTIDREKYITLESGDNRRLATIVHATELGDNVSASTTETGSTQYVRNNPFWDNNEDVATLIDEALAAVGGLTINQFECEWRGNPLLEIGDKIALVTKDNNTVTSYVLDDVITYDGSFSQSTRWSYEDAEAEGADNPTSLGDVLKQTYARVDKANKQIDLVVSETAANTEAISNLQLDTEGIHASVSKIEEDVVASLEGINEELSTLTTRVDAAITSEDVTIAIQSELANGVDRVTTSTGFTFNEDGLTVSKTDSEMTTTITEDGMTVYKNEEAVLTANNAGVNAVNLHATTYLIIGTNSRFEDYGGNRTGCFWIGN